MLEGDIFRRCIKIYLWELLTRAEEAIREYDLLPRTRKKERRATRATEFRPKKGRRSESQGGRRPAKEGVDKQEEG